MTIGPARTFVEGRIVRLRSTAMQLSYRDGPGEPFAQAVQGAGDGIGAKIGILFGFKNGGPGQHVLTYRDRAELHITSRLSAPTLIARSDGTPVASISRAATSIARTAAGEEVLRFRPDPDEPRTADAYRLMLNSPDDEPIGRLDVIRTPAGWGVDTAAGATPAPPWLRDTGDDLPVPFLGVRLMLLRQVSRLERDVLLAAGVDLAIGLRPYVAAMI